MHHISYNNRRRHHGINKKGASIINSWAEVGATWWLEAMWDDPDPDHVLARVRYRPPQVG
jgi:hypothetical protein